MNREFMVGYYRLEADIHDARRFRTLKQLADWLNSNEEAIVIDSITELPGRAVFDKYYKSREER